MDNQEQQQIKSVANIVRQQPINPMEPNSQSPRPSLDQRIQDIQTKAAQVQRSLSSVSQPTSTTVQSTHPHHTKAIKPTPEKPTTSQTTTGFKATIMPPVLQKPKKSTLSFIQRFVAHHANHQNPDYKKIASITHEQNPNQDIPIYMFKDEKRAYEAAEAYGKNLYKFGGKTTEYFPTTEKVPNRMKFSNEFQKQVWIHTLETIGTYNIYTLLGKFEKEENIIIHSVYQPIDVYFTGIKGPIPMASKRSIQAFSLTERNRNVIIQTTEKRTIVVIESIIPGSETKLTSRESDDCHVQKAIIGQQGYSFHPDASLNLPSELLFISTQGCHDESIMQEHMIEVTIMGYQGNVILSTIVTPRVFVTINPDHLGFEEDDLTMGKDEFTTIKEIQRITLNKTIVGYDIKKTMRLCNIRPYAIHGYIDLEKHESLRRKCGIFTNKIKLPLMVKKFNIKGKFPMRTEPRCFILKQLWKQVEKETLEIIQINHQYNELDVLELQNKMEDEFTSIGKTPITLPRKLIQDTNQKPRMKTPTNSWSINTSPMKRLRLTSNENNVQIPLIESIQKKCRVQNSNIPKICFINGKEHQIQAIIVNPIKEPDQTIICQASQSRDSQGREIFKGGRYVRDPLREDSE